MQLTVEVGSHERIGGQRTPSQRRSLIDSLKSHNLITLYFQGNGTNAASNALFGLSTT